jgi:hypothetical protein
MGRRSLHNEGSRWISLVERNISPGWAVRTIAAARSEIDVNLQDEDAVLIEIVENEFLDRAAEVDHHLVTELRLRPRESLQELALELVAGLRIVEKELELDVSSQEQGEVHAIGADVAKQVLRDLAEARLDGVNDASGGFSRAWRVHLWDGRGYLEGNEATLGPGTAGPPEAIGTLGGHLEANHISSQAGWSVLLVAIVANLMVPKA